MPKARASDGVELHYEVTGKGAPILFIHEFAGDHRSWTAQVHHFEKIDRCITYAARGYPPSNVPTEPGAYSQQRAVDDAVTILDAAGASYGAGKIGGFIVGLSMGGFTALHLVLQHPERVYGAVIAGVGYGSQPKKREQFKRESLAIAGAFERDGSAMVAESYAVGPARVQLQNKHPDTWRDFAEALAQHDATGAALTMRGVQAARPSLYDLSDQLRAIRTPVLIIAGDEDEGSLEASLMLKRTISTSGLVILPKTGHTINLEEPEAFNKAVADFFMAVEDGLWPERDPRAVPGSITGVKTS
jgi:pimeloyl-ACP methyl ester carboxylesterase